MFLLMWLVVEVNVGIMCVCIFMFKLLIVRILLVMLYDFNVMRWSIMFMGDELLFFKNNNDNNRVGVDGLVNVEGVLVDIVDFLLFM